MLLVMPVNEFSKLIRKVVIETTALSPPALPDITSHKQQPAQASPKAIIIALTLASPLHPRHTSYAALECSADMAID